MYNISIKLGYFPDSCKKFLYKKGIKLALQIAGYYRCYLWSLKSSKNLSMNKEVAFNLTMKFYTTINPDFESHSTASYLTFLHDKILKGFDKCLMNGVILIDFQKAIDTIHLDILMKKLIAIGL